MTCCLTHCTRRYKIYWTVNGNADGNSQSLLSDFFYVGARGGASVAGGM